MNTTTSISRLIVLALFVVLCNAGCKRNKHVVDITKPSDKPKIEQDEALRKQQEEERRKADEAEQARLAKADRDKAASAPAAKLGLYFDAIANANNATSANNSINEALGLFANADVPVLIIISGSGDQKDYDRPTTIRAYLNYLKDQKTNINRVENLETDASGKITSIELRKELEPSKN